MSLLFAYGAGHGLLAYPYETGEPPLKFSGESNVSIKKEGVVFGFVFLSFLWGFGGLSFCLGFEAFCFFVAFYLCLGTAH